MELGETAGMFICERLRQREEHMPYGAGHRENAVTKHTAFLDGFLPVSLPRNLCSTVQMFPIGVQARSSHVSQSSLSATAG